MEDEGAKDVKCEEGCRPGSIWTSASLNGSANVRRSVLPVTPVTSREIPTCSDLAQTKKLALSR